MKLLSTVNAAATAAVCLAALAPPQAQAATATINFAGTGFSGTLALVYGPATDAKVTQGFEVTSISGTFTDTNNGLNIVNASIGGLVAITRDTPESKNTLAPNDFSRFAVASGLDPISNGFLTYDNLFYPGGSPQTGSDYPASGGVLDIYGLMFTIGGGRVVNFWSAGTFNPAVPATYGVAVATASNALDYVGDGITASVPEPASVVQLLAGLGLVGAMLRRRAGH
jgi:hypothetical protein